MTSINRTAEGLPVVSKETFHEFLSTLDTKFRERSQRLIKSNPEVAGYIGQLSHLTDTISEFSKRELRTMTNIYNLLGLQATNDRYNLPIVSRGTLEVFVRDHPEHPNSDNNLRVTKPGEDLLKAMERCRDAWNKDIREAPKQFVDRYLYEIGGENPIVRDYISIMKNQPDIYRDSTLQNIAMQNMASVYLLLKAQARQDKIDALLGK